jgi:D-alanyl-lipoteichoic acid acyltransferase DltB (MBOAT superfamily)
LVATLAFAFQIYTDFSAYSDIARGLAKIMGFEFTLNFNLPYFARNPSDFWQRWHISLSSWLRDYLYIPLGGNRGTPSRTYFNLVLTMVIGGLWHGAAWTFVIWGAYHGALLVGHRLVSPMLARMKPFSVIPSPVSTAVAMMIMFLFTLYGWLIFRAESVPQLVEMTTALAHPFAGLRVDDLLIVIGLILPLIIVQSAQYCTGRLGIETLLPRSLAARTVCYSVLAYGTVFVGGQPSEFIYFQF